MKIYRNIFHLTVFSLTICFIVMPRLTSAEDLPGHASILRVAHSQTEGTQITRNLKTTIDQVVDILRDENLKKDHNTRRKILEQTIEKRFNYQQMAIRALAGNWRKRTPSEQREFTRLFKKLLEKSYAHKIESFRDGKIDFVGEVVKGKYALVKTIIHHQGKTIALDYKLVHENNDWKVYDFVIKGVSMIRNYRTQFTKVIRKDSFEGLMRKMGNFKMDSDTKENPYEMNL